MSKLSEIIDAATDETVSIASLLRQVKVLGVRSGTQALSEWVDHELSGYPVDADLPEYRGPFQTQVWSNWSGPFGSMLKNAPLPPSAFPRELREVGAFEVDFRESVSELERLSKSDGLLSYFWGTDVVGHLNSLMQKGKLPELASMAPMHGMVSAHRVVSPALVISVLDQVRTRVLGLALDIERIAPEAGEPGAELGDQGAVHNIVHAYIYGDGNTIAVDSPGAVQVAYVTAGDMEALLAAVRGLGLDEGDVEELRSALEGDAGERDVERVGLGTRATQFMGKVAMGGLTKAGEAGTQEGVKILSGLLRSYVGLPP